MKSLVLLLATLPACAQTQQVVTPLAPLASDDLNSDVQRTSVEQRDVPGPASPPPVVQAAHQEPAEDTPVLRRPTNPVDRVATGTQQAPKQTADTLTLTLPGQLPPPARPPATGATLMLRVPQPPPATPATLPPPAGQQPSKAANALTLDELERLALANNPTLVQAQAGVDSRVGAQVQAGLYPNPRLGYSHNELGNNNRGGQQGAYVAQEFVRGGKLALAQHAASHAVVAAEFRQAAQQLRVLTSVRTAFYDVLVAQATISLAEQLVEISQQGVATAEALIQAGQSPRVDLLQARVALNNARIEAQKARNRHQAAWKRLAAVVGAPNRPPAPLAGTLETDAAPLDSQQVFQSILAASPELAAAQQQVLRAQVALQRARVEPVPNVDVMAGVQYDYSTTNTIVNLQAEVPLPVRNRNQGDILKAQAELTAAYGEVERIELDLQNRFAATLERYANAAAQVKRYKESIIPDAQESLKLLSEAFKAEGRIDFLRLLLAQRTNFTTQIDYLNALRALRAAGLEIDGMLLTGGLERPTEGP